MPGQQWPPDQPRLASDDTTELELHHRAYIAAVFTPGHAAEADYHRRWIEASEHGDPDPDRYAAGQP